MHCSCVWHWISSLLVHCPCPALALQAFLPDGQIQLGDEEDDEFPGGRTIDVEFKDVK